MNFDKKVDLSNLNSVSKLSDVLKNEVVKNSEYNELAKKVEAIQTTATSNLVKKLVKFKSKYGITIIIISIWLL